MYAPVGVRSGNPSASPVLPSTALPLIVAGAESKSNPAFAQTRLVSPTAPASPEPRILRGYIRRSKIDASDPYSGHRLNFMFNPDVIERSYLSYLDQLALDPNNATFGSGNATAAPGIIDFSFELFFDRQIETSWSQGRDGVPDDVVKRGVLVDYEYFDKVVRGAVPGLEGEGITDNGIMVVNPGNITVVFGPQLTVTGRPYNATVRFEKFTHRMIPTRVRIGITMKALHVGPPGEFVDVSDLVSESLYRATVPYDTIEVSTSYDADPIDLTWDETAPQSSQEGSNFAAPAVSGAPYAGTLNVGGILNLPRGQLSIQQVASLVISAGFRGEMAALLVAICWRESKWNSDMHNPNRNTGDNSYGLFQLNMIDNLGVARRAQYGISSNEELFWPAVNMRCAVLTYQEAERMYGNPLQPWYIDARTGRPTVTGYELEQIGPAREAVRALGAYR